MFLKQIALVFTGCIYSFYSLATPVERKYQRVVDALRFSHVNVATDTDSLRVQFEGNLPRKHLKNSAALRLIPKYVTANGEYVFPEILINGSTRAAFYTREQALLTPLDCDKQHRVRVFRQERGEGVRFVYSDALPVPKGAYGQLVIDAYLENCCKSDFVTTVRLLAGTPSQIPLFFERNVTFFRPQLEKVKARSTGLGVYVNFQTGKHELLPAYKSNASELAKVDSVLRPMQRNPDLYTVSTISIHGFASPEAPAASNMRLSQLRANVFRDYIVNQYGLQTLSDVPAIGMGEDWVGLHKALIKKPISHQEQVLEVLERTEVYDEREQLLRKIDGGHVWRRLLDDYFPSLRRMDMKISYTVRALALNEAEVMLDGRPQDLSAAEFFDVARWRNSDNVLATHRQYYGREYTIATEYFPHDPVSWLNAATAALLRGETKVAKTMLEHVGDTPLSYLNQGLYHWSIGDTVRAEYYFQLAATVESTKVAAEYNLQQLSIWEQQRMLSSSSNLDSK
jgi:hypothetical protein